MGRKLEKCGDDREEISLSTRRQAPTVAILLELDLASNSFCQWIIPGDGLEDIGAFRCHEMAQVGRDA
jgi:hypothetical protein